MDEEYKVVWTRSAVSDLESIIEYIAKDSPSAAKILFRKLKKQTETLSYSPQRSRYLPELQEQGIFIYRELIISPWRVMYRVHERNVYVMAMIDSRKNVEDILLEKLIKI